MINVNQNIRNAVEKAINSNHIYIDSLASPFNELYPKIGYAAVETICSDLGGTTIYIPKIQFLFREAIESQIKIDFDGTNYRDLAKKYNISERKVRSII